ncbi:hypothetical protein [Viscerimonas tarda]
MTGENVLIENLVYLHDLYIRSREAIAFLENYDREKKSYLGPHNELRNAFDHVMRMIEKRDDSAGSHEEFRGAESHLLRAGYDAYELICIIHIDYIKNVLGEYSSDEINGGFPEYYKSIRPQIFDIEKATAKIREIKRQERDFDTKVKDSVLGSDTYEYYFEAASRLENFVREVDRHIPSIGEFHQELIKKQEKQQKDDLERQQKEKKWKLVNIIGWAIALLVSILAILFR